MTTEFEKQFFSTFGIEPKYEDACRLADEYWNNEHLANAYGVFDNYMEAMGCPINKDGCTDNCRHAYTKKIYPQITDRILLKLISFIGKKGFGFLYCENTFTTGFGNRKDLITVQAENFKEGILTLAIQKKTVLRIKKDVQALFKEER